MNTNTIIKEAVRAFKVQGYPILANWDAGGDQTPCNVQINGKYDVTYKDINICEELRSAIIYELSLPNSGETYHTGSGEIDINLLDEVVIKFTAVRYTDCYDGFYPNYFYYKDETWRSDSDKEDFPEINKLKITKEHHSIDDPLGFIKLLNRAQVTFMARINDELTIENKLYLEVRQGDAPETSEAKLKPYFDTINELLFDKFDIFKAQEEALKQQEGYYPFHSMILEAILTKPGEVECLFKPSQEEFFAYNNEKIVLIP